MALSSQLPQPPLKESKKSSPAEIVVFVVLIILLILGWTYRQQLFTWINNVKVDTGSFATKDKSEQIFVGKHLILSGNIERNLQTQYPYTHIITTTQYGQIGLRSSLVNLFDLTGTVEVSGTISDFINNIFVLEVEDYHIRKPDNSNQRLYFSTPGILIQGIGSGFTAVQQSFNNSITLQDKKNDKLISIRYFLCSDTEDITNCHQYNQVLNSTTGSKLSDSYGNIFYQLNDKSTRFTTIDEKYGIYIEVNDDQLFPYLMEHLQFISTEWARKSFSTSAKTYCTAQGQTLQSITSGSLSTQDKDVLWTILGTTNTPKSTITCVLKFNPEVASPDFSLISAQIKTDQQTTLSGSDTNSTQQDSSSSQSGNTINPDNEPQIPLKQDKGLSFTTNGGITVKFPTPNIYFSSQSTSSGPHNESCSSKINIVSFKDQEKVETTPDVVVYICKSSGASSANIRTITHGSDILLIEAVNPARVDFANAIIIE